MTIMSIVTAMQILNLADKIPVSQNPEVYNWSVRILVPVSTELFQLEQPGYLNDSSHWPFKEKN
jgi:hypothetical protein